MTLQIHESTVLTDASILTKYYTNILLLLHTLYLYNKLFYEININFDTKKNNKVILLSTKLYKTQTETMTRNARSFTNNNQTKICRLPVPHIHKPGWQQTHSFQKKILTNSAAPIIITGDSIATRLKRYRHIWRNYFKDALNLGIGGGRVKNVLWRARDISLQHTASFVIINCRTNNVD